MEDLQNKTINGDSATSLQNASINGDSACSIQNIRINEGCASAVRNTGISGNYSTVVQAASNGGCVNTVQNTSIKSRNATSLPTISGSSLNSDPSINSDCITSVPVPCENSHSIHNVITLYKRRWVILAVFCLMSMSNEIIWISYSSIASIVKGYYRVTYSAVSWLAMIFSVFYFLSPLALVILHRYGWRVTIITGAILNAIASYFRIAGRHRNGFVYVMVGNGFAAFAQCFILFVPPALASVWFSDNERAKATSIGVQANMFGVAVGFLMGSVLVPSSEDYDGIVKERIFLTLLIQAILCSVLALISFTFLKEEPLKPPSMSQYLKRKKKQAEMARCASVIENKNVSQTEKSGLVDSKQVPNEAASNVHPSEYESFPAIEHECRIDMRRQRLSSKTTVDLNVQLTTSQKFFRGLKKLFKSINFHLVVQAFALYSCPFFACSVNLNQWCTLLFRGEEQNIGLMGFSAVILGLISLPLAGAWVDKTHRYKLISLVILSGSTASMLIFTIVLTHSHNFYFTFVAFCVCGFFMYPYMPVAMEHAGDLTYPISDEFSSNVMYALGNTYGMLSIYVIGLILDADRADIAGFVMVGIYFVSLLCAVFIKGRLKRCDADMSNADVTLDDDGDVDEVDGE